VLRTRGTISFVGIQEGVGDMLIIGTSGIRAQLGKSHLEDKGISGILNRSKSIFRQDGGLTTAYIIDIH
jgi:hypothetical protein